MSDTVSWCKKKKKRLEPKKEDVVLNFTLSDCFWEVKWSVFSHVWILLGCSGEDCATGRVQLHFHWKVFLSSSTLPYFPLPLRDKDDQTTLSGHSSRIQCKGKKPWETKLVRWKLLDFSKIILFHSLQRWDASLLNWEQLIGIVLKPGRLLGYTFFVTLLLRRVEKKKSIEHHEDKKTKITMMQAEPSFQGCLDTCFEKDYTCDFVLGLNLSTWTRA